MRRDIPFTSWRDLSIRSRGREVILFGAADIAEKTYRRIGGECIVSGMVDNAQNLWGDHVLGLSVEKPESLLARERTVYVVVTTTSFRDVSEQLVGMGFEPLVDFMVSPFLNDLRIIDELESVKTTVMFSSGSAPSEDPKFGGGIYELAIEKDVWEYRKKMSGNTYGIIPFDDGYLTVDANRGLVHFDQRYNIVRTGTVPTGARGHGITISADQEAIFLACSGKDALLVFDKDLRLKNEFSISNKITMDGTPQHHCNDCVWSNGFVYVCMFSVSGNWKQDVFDGGIVEMHPQTGEIQSILRNDLHMPHNVALINGQMVVLESLPGHLRLNNFSVAGTFPAFSRGLAHDGAWFYIGQSRNRNYSRNLGVSNNISIDVGVIIFDEITKASRFVQLHPRLSEIHAIQVLD